MNILIRRGSVYLASARKESSLLLARVMQDIGLDLDRRGSSMTRDVAFRLKYSRHRVLTPAYEKHPIIHEAWVAPNASLLGEVLVGSHVKIWYNAVIHGEVNAVRIGNFSSIGDGAVLTALGSLPPGIPCSVNIGKNVRIGQGASVFSSIIDDDAVIGDHTVIMQGCRVERGAVVAPNSVVPPGRQIPAGQLWAGSPVEYGRDLEKEELWGNYEASYGGAVGGRSSDTFALYPGLEQGELEAETEMKMNGEREDEK